MPSVTYVISVTVNLDMTVIVGVTTDNMRWNDRNAGCDSSDKFDRYQLSHK